MSNVFYSYCLKEKFIQIEIEGVTKEGTMEELNVKADLKYEVDFKILGN